jgi:DNA polymerase-3 subunit epsilon
MLPAATHAHRAEFERAGVRNFPPVGVPVVDSQRIHFAKESRTLTAALAHYCGKVLKGAHGALADTRAALDVLRAQVARYPDLPRTPEGLSAWCSAGRNGDATWDGKFRWSGDAIVFGCGFGWGINEAENTRGYTNWWKHLPYVGMHLPQSLVIILW